MISIDLITALPELFLSVTALVLLMVGVYWGRDSTRMVLLLSVGAVAVAFVLVLLHPRNAPDAFGGLFVAASRWPASSSRSSCCLPPSACC
jgi:NADH-quinone oxidoreductase subunit N